MSDKKRILIVDDAPVIRLMLKDIFTFNNFEVVGEAANGNEAVVKYEELKPDLVTMDIIMPEADGIHGLTEILKLDPEANVVMVTAIDQRRALMEAVKLGAKDYIVKPFDENRVLSAVEKILK